jgi:hypothetical protein
MLVTLIVALAAAATSGAAGRNAPRPGSAAAGTPSGAPVPEFGDADFIVPVAAPADGPVGGAPSSTQTSEFMAGTVVYSIVFVESSGGAGFCSPADAQTENWDLSRRLTVISEIQAGVSFWASRTSRPDPLTFLLDDLGTMTTSCEPINHPFNAFGERGKWIADVLVGLGFPATPATHQAVARQFVDSRRDALGADFGILILVVDSLNDGDGSYPDGRNGAGDLNGPMQYLTYDNGGWGIDRMNYVSLHELGHNFGALDEYASGCSTADSWGYFNVANASCNNGGVTSDISVMGEGSELVDPAADVSASARAAIGWRSPAGDAGKIVDVVRTSTASLTPYVPDPTGDSTPTYVGNGANVAFPPGGCNTLGGVCYRLPSATTISRVAEAEWRLDGGTWTADGVAPADGAFDEESDGFTFTPSFSVTPGAHVFSTRAVNQFGHESDAASDALTISAGPTGWLRVLTSPARPSQVVVDGQVADSWGVWMKVPVGQHAVSFTDVEGYATPADQVVGVSEGATTTVTGVFVQQGLLRVLTSPAVAATVSVDGMARNDWGVWTWFATGSHSVCFGPVAGFTAPPCQNASLTAGNQTTVTGTYGAGS